MRLSLPFVFAALVGCDHVIYDWETHQQQHAVTCPSIAATPGVWEDITPSQVSLVADAPSGNRGVINIAASTSDPTTLYLGTYRQGIWKSTDGGDQWQKVSTGQNHDQIDGGETAGLAVDPTTSDRLYATAANGEEQGLWRSTNGGVDWEQTILADTVTAIGTGAVQGVAIDPADPRHLLVSFHSGWRGGDHAGFLESTDGGDSWILHEPQFDWASGHTLMFLSEPGRWLLSSQYTGVYLTTDAGGIWTRVNGSDNQAGVSAAYYSGNGVIYVAARPQVIRSADGGVSWISVGPPNDGYASVIGDGERLFTASYDPVVHYGGPQLTYASADSDGLTWQPLSDQRLLNGPRVMVASPECNVIWSANERAGLLRMLTQ